MSAEPAQARGVSYFGEYTVEGVLKLFKLHDIKPETKVSMYQVVMLIATKTYPKKSPPGEIYQTGAQIIAKCVAGFEINTDRRYPGWTLAKYGYDKGNLEALIDDYKKPRLKIVHREYGIGDKVSDDISQYVNEINPRNFRWAGESMVLSRGEEAELAARIKAGDMEARKMLINMNLRLVVSVVNKYMHYDVELEDLIEWGNEGLMRAIDKFDPFEHGNKFSTYAVYWIKQIIPRNLMDHKKCVHIPLYMREELNLFLEIQEEYLGGHNRPPSIEELCKETRWEASKAKHVMKIYENHFKFDHPPPLKVDLITGVYDQRHEEEENRMKWAQFMGVFPRLSEREQLIVALRHGLFGHKPGTLKEVGRKVGLSRERVRQIDDKAMNKIRLWLDCPER